MGPKKAVRGRGRGRKTHNSDDESDLDVDLRACRGSGPIAKTTVPRMRAGPSDRRFSYREKFDLNIIVAQDEVEAHKEGVASWTSANAGPPLLKCRRFCCVCGFEAIYECSKCATHRPSPYERYYCSFRCQKLHGDSDCMKPRHLLNW